MLKVDKDTIQQALAIAYRLEFEIAVMCYPNGEEWLDAVDIASKFLHEADPALSHNLRIARGYWPELDYEQLTADAVALLRQIADAQHTGSNYLKIGLYDNNGTQ